MFLFPLGLDAKTQRFPIATVLIFIGTVAYSVAHIDDCQHQASATLNSVKTHELFRARTALAVAACSETELPSDSCDFLKHNLPVDHPTNPLVTHARLTQAANRTFGRTGPSKLGEIAPYLFEDHYWLKHQQSLQNHLEFQDYRRARDAFLGEEAGRQAKSRMLSRVNLTPESVFFAQISHAGWLHLIGNMVFFLLLAIPVEERVGPLAFLFVHLFGGTVGLLGHLFFTSDATLSVVGASANISAIAGLFLALFQKSEMRIWVSALFIWNKVATMRTEIFIPVFIVASDVVGFMGAGESVAHLAHLFGMAIGIVAGLSWRRMKPLGEGVLFPFENELLILSQNTPSKGGRLNYLNRLLFYHTSSRQAQALALKTLLESPVATWHELEHDKKAFLDFHFASLFNSALVRYSMDEFSNLIGQFPIDWPVEKFTSSVDLDRLYLAITHCVSTQQATAAIHLLRILKTSSTDQHQISTIDEKIETLSQRSHDVRAAS